MKSRRSPGLGVSAYLAIGLLLVGREAVAQKIPFPPESELAYPNPVPDPAAQKELFLRPRHPSPQPMMPPSAMKVIEVENSMKLPRARGQARSDFDPLVGPAAVVRFVAPEKFKLTFVRTPRGPLPEVDPFLHPPGTNLLPNVYRNMRDGRPGPDNEMPNTLPSTPDRPYNLHDGDPVVTAINPTSPTDDLRATLDELYEILTGIPPRRLWERLDKVRLEEVFRRTRDAHEKIASHRAQVKRLLARAVDIIEGNPVDERAYSGFPLLHYKGPKRITRVMPVFDETGKVIGGNADVHQVWYDGRIESDTMFMDFGSDDPKTAEAGSSRPVPIPPDVPWTITYTLDVLTRGADDFSPTTMYFDHPSTWTPAPSPAEMARVEADPKVRSPYRTTQAFRMAMPGEPGVSPATAGRMPIPHVSMDQSFFPMETGTKTVVKVKMAPHQYYNLTYTWGWRRHPPRAQAVENSHKRLPPTSNKRITEYEEEVFGAAFAPPADPNQPFAERRRVIEEKISDLAPAKRMWHSFRDALAALDADQPDFSRCLHQVLDARDAFLDWNDRNHLPSGIEVDKDTDLTLLYANNTIYGEFRDGSFNAYPEWRKRGTVAKVTLINGDYFKHGYLNVDFGGARGWENQFKPTLQSGGSGTFFSFGRFHWNMNNMPFMIQEAVKKGDKTEPSVHKVYLEYNFEPSRRLRFYQFDPFHHDVSIFSVH